MDRVCGDLSVVLERRCGSLVAGLGAVDVVFFRLGRVQGAVGLWFAVGAVL